MILYRIIDAASGEVRGSQVQEDNFAPILSQGQIGVPVTGSFDSATGTFTATGGGTAFAPFPGDFNISVWGAFVASVALERSFDGGTTWLNCSFNKAGLANSFSAPFSIVANELERGVLYRVRCVAFASGTVSWRLSQ